MDEAEANQFLESLLGKTLHVTVPDGKAAGIGGEDLADQNIGRLFSGTFRCTDNVRL